MAGRQDDGTDLDAMLAASREEAVPDALMARVLADAGRVQTGWAQTGRVQTEAGRPVPARPAMRPRLGVTRRMLRAAGGGAAALGLATATLAGLWIGLAQPAALSPVSQSLWPEEAGAGVELIPSLDEVLSYAEG